MFTRRGRQEGPPQRTLTATNSGGSSQGRQYNLNWPALSRDAAIAKSGSGGSGGEKTETGTQNEKPTTSEKPGMRERARTMFGARNYNSEPLEGDPNQQHHPRISESEGCSSGPDESPTVGIAGNVRRTPPSRRKTRGLHLPLPTPAPFTLAQTRTPGWDTPWSGGSSGPGGRSSRSNTNVFVGQGSNLGVRDYAQLNGHGHDNGASDTSPDGGRNRSKWYRRRKRIRAFVLNNSYVPLVRTSPLSGGALELCCSPFNADCLSLQLFRVINITLTTAALAVAITIRRIEKKYGILGAVGSSPSVPFLFSVPLHSDPI